jgi:sec-independent protein translocase protein TatA
LRGARFFATLDTNCAAVVPGGGSAAGSQRESPMSIGIWQVVLILLIVLILFGAGKLPKVMGDVAKGVKNFKSGMKEDDEDLEKPAISSDASPTAPDPSLNRDEVKS